MAVTSGDPKPMLRHITRFGLVGLVGFVTDALILFMLVTIGMNAFLARIISFLSAVAVTWLLNSAWTFSDPGRKRSRHQIALYFALQIFAALINFGLYSLVLWQIGISPLKSVFALACGSALGMFINFVGARALLAPRS